MTLRQFAGKFLQQATDQNRIAVADLSWFGGLVRRNDFVAGGEMNDVQARADERLRAARGGKQRESACVQPCAGRHKRRAGFYILTAFADIQSAFVFCDSE